MGSVRTISPRWSSQGWSPDVRSRWDFQLQQVSRFTAEVAATLALWKERAYALESLLEQNKGIRLSGMNFSAVPILRPNQNCAERLLSTGAKCSTDGRKTDGATHYRNHVVGKADVKFYRVIPLRHQVLPDCICLKTMGSVLWRNGAAISSVDSRSWRQHPVGVSHLRPPSER